MSLVLVFNTVARADLAARLHSESCSMVRARGGVVVIREDLECEMQDLCERGFPVKRCKCCEVAS